MPKATRRPSASGEETRTRIVAATLATLKSEGIAGTSARAIAREGDFNQALIFYHFGSVDDAIVAAVAEMSNRRMERHRDGLAQATTISELVQIARSLHESDSENDNMTVLTQAFAGAAGDPEMGPKLYSELDRWSDVVAEALGRVLADAPMVDNLPHAQIARAISALFLGVELLDDLDPSRANAEELFDVLESMAQLLEGLLVAGPLLSLFTPDA